MEMTTIGSARTCRMLCCAFALLLAGARADERTWTLLSGRTIDAQYVKTTLNDEALLEKSDGAQIEIPLKQLSPNDLAYISLQHPPKLKIEFADSSKVDTMDCSDQIQNLPAVVQEIVQFKVSIKREDTKDYDFGLNVEYYAVGYQYLDQDKYMLLAKGEEDFFLNEEYDRPVEFSTSRIKLPMEFVMDSNHYGRKYTAYLVLVTDQRGELIASRSSKNWLFNYREKLRKLPVGAFFDNKCTRVHASGPKPNY